jgi:hypothetical protein
MPEFPYLESLKVQNVSDPCHVVCMWMRYADELDFAGRSTLRPSLEIADDRSIGTPSRFLAVNDSKFAAGKLNKR